MDPLLKKIVDKAKLPLATEIILKTLPLVEAERLVASTLLVRSGQRSVRWAMQILHSREYYLKNKLPPMPGRSNTLLRSIPANIATPPLLSPLRPVQYATASSMHPSAPPLLSPAPPLAPSAPSLPSSALPLLSSALPLLSPAPSLPSSAPSPAPPLPSPAPPPAPSATSLLSPAPPPYSLYPNPLISTRRFTHHDCPCPYSFSGTPPPYTE